MNQPAVGYDYEIDFAAIFSRLRESWLFVLCSIVIGAITGGLIAFTMQPLYVAVATIAPISDAQQSNATALMGQIGGLASLAGIDISSMSQGRAQHSVPYLQSRMHAEEFVRQNDLVQVVLADRKADNPPTIWKATERVRKRVLRVDVDRRTNLISVSVEWSDAGVAADWANRFIQLANESLRKRDQTRAEKNIAFLNSQLTKTNLIGLQQVLLNLLESEMRTAMLTNADEEYAFTVIDPAIAAETPSKPRRALMMLGGGFAGAFISLLAVPFLRPLRRGFGRIFRRDRSSR